jgi:hypothetical protein
MPPFFIHAIAKKAINPSFTILLDDIVSATHQFIYRKSRFFPVIGDATLVHPLFGKNQNSPLDERKSV